MTRNGLVGLLRFAQRAFGLLRFARNDERLLLRIGQSHVVKDEGVDVGLLLEDLGNGFAAAVTCLAVDADNLGL